MILLANVGDVLRVKLTGAKTTKDMDVFITWRDYQITPVVIVNVFRPDRSVCTTNGTTAVDICTEPFAEIKRIIDYLSVHNCDTAAKTAQVIYKTTESQFILFQASLPVGATLQYSNGNGFSVRLNTGAIRYTTG